MALDGGYRGAWGPLDHQLCMAPSEYFRRNVFLSYISDPIGLNNLRLTGADHFLWSGDYPHDASTWPNSEARLRKECADAGVAAADIRKLGCTNTATLYDFDLAVVEKPSALIADSL